MPAISRAPRIAIIHDHDLVVAGVTHMLAPYPDRVDVVDLDHEDLPGADAGVVDLVLVDTFALVGGEAVALEEVVHVGGPKVVVFSWVTDPLAVEQALAHGAAGYLSKTLPRLELLEALEDIQAGTVVVRDSHGRVPDVGSEGSPARVHLSPREREVLALVAQGLSNKEIARTVFLSVNSIKTYTRTAYAKIGVHSRSQAVCWVHAHDSALPSGIAADPRRRERRHPGVNLDRFQKSP